MHCIIFSGSLYRNLCRLEYIPPPQKKKKGTGGTNKIRGTGWSGRQGAQMRRKYISMHIKHPLVHTGLIYRDHRSVSR